MSCVRLRKLQSLATSLCLSVGIKCSAQRGPWGGEFVLMRVVVLVRTLRDAAK